MQKVSIILLGVAMLAYASTRSPDKTKLSRFQHLKGWQKIFGILAVLVALLLILNPEFLALGLIGDTAFFDMLVLALSLQLHVIATRAFHSSVDAVSRSVRWLTIPSPGLRYLLALTMPAIAGAVTAFQKAVHRMLS
jgi:uncharacterized membrane protein YkgB